MTTEARILKSASEGVSIRAIAADHGMSEAEVTAVLDRAAEVWFTGEHLRRELLLEVSRALHFSPYARALCARA
jgi:hypothetical protein